MFPVAIEDDQEVEGDESFTVTLTNPRPDGVVLNPDRITITIRDNDGECHRKHMHKYRKIPGSRCPCLHRQYSVYTHRKSTLTLYKYVMGPLLKQTFCFTVGPTTIKRVWMRSMTVCM